MKKITRTFETHTIFAEQVSFEQGKIITSPLEPISVFNETVTNDNALKLIRKKYGKNNNYIIKEIVTKRTTYSMDIDKFMDLSDVVDN